MPIRWRRKSVNKNIRRKRKSKMEWKKNRIKKMVEAKLKSEVDVLHGKSPYKCVYSRCWAAEKEIELS